MTTGLTRESSEGHHRSDSAEPWDEPGSKQQLGGTTSNNNNSNTNNNDDDTMRRDTYGYEEQELEDGDLPTLSLSHSRSGGGAGGGGGGVVGRPTSSSLQAKSLRSPSQEAELTKQRAFWKQLDSPSSLSKGDTTNAEEGPDDEMGARRTAAEAREDSKNKSRSKKSRKGKSGGKGDDYTEQMRTADSEDSEDDSRDSKEYVVGDNEETNFCDHTLSAMEAICGETGLQICGGTATNNGTISNPTNADSERSRKAKNLNILNARDDGDSVDEHTAIEVEYVEPPEDTAGMAQERPENWSPTRKNAYLAAMARKAKEDFEKSQAKEMASMSPKRNKAAAATPSVTDSNDSAEDVYNSFTAGEKRKFLRLINSGVSPTESAQRVRAERSKTSKSSKEGKSSKKGKLFKFWKKGSSKSKAAPPTSSTTTPPPQPHEEETLDRDGFPVVQQMPHAGQEEKKEDDHRPVVVEEEPTRSVQETVSADDESTFEGLERDPTQESEAQSTTEDSQRENTPEPIIAAAANDLRNASPVDRSVERDVTYSRGTLDEATTTSSSSTKEEKDLSVGRPSPDKSSVASSNQERDASVSPPTNTQDSAEKETQDSGGAAAAALDQRFAKSGINYYDAVRRQLSESDDETNFSSSVSPPSKTKNHRAPRLGPILQSAKLKGFSKLSKGGKASAQKLSTPTSANQRQVAAVTPDTAGSEWSYQEQEQPGMVTPRTSDRVERDGGEFSTQEEEKSEIDAYSPEAGSFSPLVVTPDYSTSAHDAKGHQSVSSESSGKMVDEEEVLGLVEKELLRPVSRFTSPVPTALDSTFEQNTPATTERSFQSDAFASPAARPKDDSDFNMQDYLNSTEVYSQSGYANDTMSVTSGTTAETSLYGGGSVFTQSTSLTQSSRKRRPGAAKTRLAKAKEADKQASKKKGWHESIRAAAQTNNRVWKPKEGWVDYQVPDKDNNTADLSTSNASPEKMHLNLAVGQASKHSEGESFENGTRDDNQQNDLVPFPSDWEKERSAMVQKQVPTSTRQPETVSERATPADQNHEKTIPPKQSSQSHENSLPMSLDDMSVEQSVAYSVEQFVQSVGATSPARPAQKRAGASPLRAQRASNSPSKRRGWVDSMRAATANIGDDSQSWDPMNGWAKNDDDSPENPAVETFDSPSARYGQNTIEERQNEMSERLDSASPANDEAVGYSSSVSPSTRDPAHERVEEGSTKIVMKLPSMEGTSKHDSALYEKYSNKELKSANVHEDYGPQMEKSDNDEVPLLDTSGGFPEESLNMTPTVNVVKQKVDEEDFNWFPQTRRGSSTTWAENNAEELPMSAQKSVTSKSSRRSRGPVDVDEAENLTDDSSEEEAGVEWNGVVFEQGSPSRSNGGITPNKMEASTKSESSVASLSSFSKLVPKLSQSKRDTSPIRAGRTSEPARSSWVGNSASPPRVNARMNSHQAGVAVMEESRAIHIESSETQRTSQHIDAGHASDDASATSSTVRQRLQQWERKTRTPMEAASPTAEDRRRSTGDLNRLNSATAEWKSFLGKKVSAESAAAEQHGNHTSEPRLTYVGGEPSDSLFEFSMTDGGTSVGSPTRSRPGPSKLMQASEPAYAHDASNVPPPPGSDFSDGNEINKSFLGRLASCATPMIPKRVQDGSADAMAHLAFLRTNQQDGKNGGSRFMPPHLCGRPEVILEESDRDERQAPASVPAPTPTPETRVSRAVSDAKTKGSEVKGDNRSVISEDFGAKTLYLEALEKKSAVSKPRKSSSRGRGGRSSAASDISSSSTKSHKEKWRDFLDKKARAGASPGKVRGNGSDASAAAESYAAKKVEEMMAMMASRSKSTPRSWRADPPDENKSRVVENMIREHTASNDATNNRNVYELSQQGAGQSQRGGAHQVGGSGGKTDSLVAAEELASARVNAMMQALANDNAGGMDEGEI